MASILIKKRTIEIYKHKSGGMLVEDSGLTDKECERLNIIGNQINHFKKDSKEWKSIYTQTPKDQQKVQCRIKGRAGYTGNAIYDARTATFRTYEDKENRMIITVWKANEWRVL